MGHSKAEKTKTHKRIVAIASKKFREEGLAGLAIAELMKEAGLTVGGFYKHFDSRDDLVAEAVGYGPARYRRLGRAGSYVSASSRRLFAKAQRDHPGTGCPVGVLAGDIACSDKQTRAVVTRQIERTLSSSQL
jgi:TetR/AcrR family transcriptional regulator, transcriptional repressor for nem operon